MLLLVSSPAFAAFTLIAGGAAPWETSTNVVLDTTGANLIVVTISTWYSAATFPHDYLGANNNTACYVSAAKATNTGHLFTETWYCLNPTYTGPSHGFYTDGGNFPFYVAAYSGAATSSVLDVGAISTNTTTGSTTIQPRSIIPACTNELVWFGYATEYPTWVSVSGVADAYHHAQTDTGGWKGYGVGTVLQTTAAAVNPTLTMSGSPYNGGGDSATVVAFKSASSSCGGAVTARHRVIGGE